MFSPSLIAIVALGYVGLLFALAWFGDRLPESRMTGRRRAAVYSLSLAVYCTSWTFFGAVGSAVSDGWLFAAIYLGPILVLVFGHDLMLRIIRLTRENQLTSIADFIAHRFGKSRPLAVLITLAAVLGSIPYIALQLKAVTAGVVVIADGAESLSQPLLALVLALALGVFAILFGARRLEASEHHRGLVLAVAFESLIKLIAFATVGLWAMFGLLGGVSGLLETVAADPEYDRLFRSGGVPGGFWVQTLLAAAAILCLPRQFQVTFVENERAEDLRTARWLFPLYLALFTLLVIPIAIAGLESQAGSGANPDLFLLTLPMESGHSAMTLLSFLGGFSAATGMVIVATVALATMVSNELIGPTLMQFKLHRERDFGRLLLQGRRLTILALALISWGYYLALPEADALASLGLMAFAAVIQFAPALLAGVYSKNACREGAIAGLSLGLLGWLLLVLMPSVIPSWPAWLAPGINGATLVSLLANVTALVAVSVWVRRHRPTLPMLLVQREGMRPVTIGELRRLASSFIGSERVDLAFANALSAHRGRSGDGSPDSEHADTQLLGFTERLLSGCIGAASARSVLTAGLRRSGMNTAEALSLLEQTSSAIQFNRDLLDATLDHISQGVSVVDADLRLVSWNRAYVDLLGYPADMVYLGRPVEQLIRFNLERQYGTGSKLEAAVDRRLHHMRRGTPYVFERRHDDGRAIEIRGNPMPHGGYVTTYTDISSFKRTEAELKSAYATMEQQVNKRTRELRAAIQALELAKHDAEQANRSKTRFLAAASHDLLQPLNAARLFSANLSQRSDRLSGDDDRLVRRIDHSLSVAEELLSALLDISRMDQGALRPTLADVPVAQLLEKVDRQFGALAERRGLRLRVRPNRSFVRTDPKLLQRILFNLVNNALRYTANGGVLVGARIRAGALRFEVWDTGPGIEPSERERIFEEFERLGTAEVDREGSEGLGLGLSICRRISDMLDAPLELQSRIGRGSMFAVSVPLVDPPSAERHHSAAASPGPMPGAAGGFGGLRVLCIDDDREILDGMRMLLTRWDCEVQTASARDEALARAAFSPEVIIADYHLGGGDDGLSVSRAVLGMMGRDVPVLVLTADRGDALGARIRSLGYRQLFKPVKPAALRALLRHLVDAR